MADPDDVDRYRAGLAPIEVDAAGQRWAEERPWRVQTHIGAESGMAVVDLHDLSAAVARRAVREVIASPPAAGAVVFVFGRGRHTLGPSPVLRGVVVEELRRACSEEEAWSYRMMGPARTVWITDRARAPRAATGQWGLGEWLLLALFVVAAIVAVLGALGALGT
jgi:hypothetical protein